MQHTPHGRQRGITLLESLVAIVVAALGVLGILGGQMRALADSQNSVRRAQAIRLIEDLGERLRANPEARTWMLDLPGAADGTWARGPLPKPAATCSQGACAAEDLLKHDLAHWRYAVGQLMPGGNARLFLADDGGTAREHKTQLGVVIAWRENEKDRSAAYTAPIDAAEVDKGRGANDSVSCPAHSTCHLQYIALPTRCYPAAESGTSRRLLCPEDAAAPLRP